MQRLTILRKAPEDHGDDPIPAGVRVPPSINNFQVNLGNAVEVPEIPDIAWEGEFEKGGDRELFGRDGLCYGQVISGSKAENRGHSAMRIHYDELCAGI